MIFLSIVIPAVLRNNQECDNAFYKLIFFILIIKIIMVQIILSTYLPIWLCQIPAKFILFYFKTFSIEYITLTIIIL